MEIHSYFTEQYDRLYAEEGEAERIIADAYQIAAEERSTGQRFDSEQEAEAYVIERILPFFNEKGIRGNVVLEANGQNISYPQPAVEIDEHTRRHTLMDKGAAIGSIADPPVRGTLDIFEAVPVLEPDEAIPSYYIAVRALIKLPGQESLRLSSGLRVAYERSAIVDLDETTSIVSYRLKQLREVERLLEMSTQPERAYRLVKLLNDVEDELLKEERDFKDFDNIRTLRETGVTASKMLEHAGDDYTERKEVIELMKNCATFIGRPVDFCCEDTFLRRSVHDTANRGVGEWEALNMSEDMLLRGKIVGIMECGKFDMNTPMTGDIPYFVISSGSDKLQSYYYVPVPHVTRLRF